MLIDDLVVNSRGHEEAIHTPTALKECLEECCLKVHPEKTKIVCCKKDGRKLKGYNLIL